MFYFSGSFLSFVSPIVGWKSGTDMVVVVVVVQAKLVLTTAVPLYQLFMSPDEVADALHKSTSSSGSSPSATPEHHSPHHDDHDVDTVMRDLMDDLGLNMQMLKSSSIFSGDEERFAFSRALSRLSEMGSQEWVERGLGMEHLGGLGEREAWGRVRSRWREDSM